MEELLHKFKLSVKKILQDHVTHGLPIDDTNLNSNELLNSIEEIFKHGLKSVY